MALAVLSAVLASAVWTGCKRGERGREAGAATQVEPAEDVPEPEAVESDSSVAEQDTGDGEDDGGPAEPEAATATSDADEQAVLPGRVTVHRLVTCREVRGGHAVRVSQTFRRQQGVRFHAFVEAETVGADDQTITVTLQSIDSPDDATRPAKLEILAGRRYRTSSSFTTWRPAGGYEVVVRDDAGTVVGRTALRVVD